MLEYENEIYLQGFEYIAGIDEVGRGSLAGPVVSCAVIMKQGWFDESINDSKKLTAKKREKLDGIIRENSIEFSFGTVENAIIDEINILKATIFSMEKALNGFTIKPNYVLIDGKDKINTSIAQKTIIDGDNLSFTIACASILAKVYRDNMMTELDLKYPEYGFAKNKGYGTKSHIEAIKTFGLTPIHRKSFCKNFL